jgi:hypothetical protein
MIRTVVFTAARGVIGNQFLGASQIEFKPIFLIEQFAFLTHLLFFYLCPPSPPSMQSLQTRCDFLLCLPFLAGLLTHARAHILLAQMLTVHKYTIPHVVQNSRPIISTTVNVVRPVVILDTFVPHRPTRVHCPRAQTLMGQNRSLVSKTAAEIQLALTVNVVRTFVLKEVLQFAPRRPTFARTLVQGTMTRPMGIYRQVLTREVAH